MLVSKIIQEVIALLPVLFCNAATHLFTIKSYITYGTALYLYSLNASHEKGAHLYCLAF